MVELPRLREERGQALSEYGMLIFLVAITVVFILLTLGVAVATLYQRIIEAVLAL